MRARQGSEGFLRLDRRLRPEESELETELVAFCLIDWEGFLSDEYRFVEDKGVELDADAFCLTEERMWGWLVGIRDVETV